MCRTFSPQNLSIFFYQSALSTVVAPAKPACVSLNWNYLEDTLALKLVTKKCDINIARPLHTRRVPTNLICDANITNRYSLPGELQTQLYPLASERQLSHSVDCSLCSLVQVFLWEPQKGIARAFASLIVTIPIWIKHSGV
jgi:hypothetical protein